MAAILGRIGAGLLSRYGGSILSAASKVVKPFFGKLMGGPAGTILKKVGPTVAEWVGEKAFMGTMRKFGDKIYDRVEASKLSPVMTGVNVGDAYYNGMKRVYDFVKNGGQVYSMGGPEGGAEAAHNVERQTAAGDMNRM